MKHLLLAIFSLGATNAFALYGNADMNLLIKGSNIALMGLPLLVEYKTEVGARLKIKVQHLSTMAIC